MKEHIALETKAIAKAHTELLGHGFKCVRIARQGKRRAGIRGDWQGWPYLVWIDFQGTAKAFAAVVVTRYKSRDWAYKPPHEVLKQEG